MPSERSPADETIGQRLKRLRIERGLSQRELAGPGVSYAYISRIEAGTREPSVKALRRLAAKLEVTPDFLETGSPIAPEAQRELRLADLELAMRLGDPGEIEVPLQALLTEALEAGDADAALRARVALAVLAMDRSDWPVATSLLESALADEAFSPVGRYDIYAHLGRAYASSGRAREAVELFERCIAGVEEAGGDAGLEARYATLLSYALSDLGDLGRAEEVVGAALAQLDDTHDPYMRVRLYWSMARLAHMEGRASIALANVRKAIALLQTTDDTLHLARAHILAGSITLTRGDPDAAANNLDRAEQLLTKPTATIDAVEITTQRSRIAALRGQGEAAVALARLALELNGGMSVVDEGRALAALANGLSLTGEDSAADEAYARAADLLEGQGQWRDTTSTLRAWARTLRANHREQEALDVLERAADLGVRTTPSSAHTTQ